MPKKSIQPLNKSQALRLLKAQTRMNCAEELIERRKTNPDLSINQMLNDLINDGLAVSHHPIERATRDDAQQETQS